MGGGGVLGRGVLVGGVLGGGSVGTSVLNSWSLYVAQQYLKARMHSPALGDVEGAAGAGVGHGDLPEAVLTATMLQLLLVVTL